MQLKSFILKNKLLSFVSFIFFFSHIYLWDLQNIIRAEGIESIETNFLRYLILFSLIGILINKNIIDKYFLFFFLIFILQSSINYFFYDQIVNLKEFGSFIFFLLLYIVVKLENERIINQLKKFFEIFIIINFLGLIIFLFFKDYQLGSACNFLLIDSVIYHENSHYGMMSTCMIVYYLYSAKNLRNNFFFGLLIFNSFIYLSVTFIAGLFVSFLACLFINILHKNKNNVPILLGLIILLLILSVKNNCSDRLNYLIKKTDNDLKILNNFESVSDEFNEKSQSFETRNKIYNELLPYRNLSSQVYNIAIHNTIYTINNRPFGWGFNSYQRLFDENIMNVIKKFYGIEYEFNMKTTKNYELLGLNKNDARSTLLKIINEFGIFSFFFMFLGFKFLFNTSINIKYKVTIISVLVTQLISGAGYFNGGFAIFLFLMITLNKLNRRN